MKSFIIALLVALFSTAAFASDDECLSLSGAKKQACYRASIKQQRQLVDQNMASLKKLMKAHDYQNVVHENTSFNQTINNACAAKQVCVLASIKNMNDHLNSLLSHQRKKK